MADESTRLVLAFFDSEDAADEAATALKDWDEATEEIKLGNVGVLVKSAGGEVKEHKLGPRSGKKGAGIGLVLGVVAAPFTAGLSLLGGAAAGAAGGGIVGSLFRKGLPKEDVERISSELEAGHAAVGALVEEGEAGEVAAKLAALGGKPEAHELSNEGLQAVAATDGGAAAPTTAGGAATLTTSDGLTEPATTDEGAAETTTPATEPSTTEVAAAVATSESGTDPTGDTPAAVRAGKFEVYRDSAGQYRWRLKARNGQIIATGGEGYATKANCENGINSVKVNVVDAEVVEV